MQRALPLPVRFLPLCSLLLLAGAQDDCTIHVTTDEDNPTCADRAEFCPDLQCEVYATDSTGCTLCECAGGEGEGEGEGECRSDADCTGGYCVISQECTCGGESDSAPDDNGDRACEADCHDVGYCVGGFGCAAVDCGPGYICVEDAGGNAQCVFDESDLCQSDGDCRDGERCNLDICINPDCANSPDGACEPVCTHGLCEAVSACDNIACSDGLVCVEGENGAECVPGDGQCFSDQDCDEGFHCEYGGQADRPACDPNGDPSCGGFVAAGTCVQNNPDECAALCGPGAECVVFDDGSIGCVPVEPTPECTGDQDCADGLTCNAADICLPDPSCSNNTDQFCPAICWGFCVEPAPASCQSDGDCAEGEICALRDTCGNCTADGCLVPCLLEGECVAAP